MTSAIELKQAAAHTLRSLEVLERALRPFPASVRQSFAALKHSTEALLLLPVDQAAPEKKPDAPLPQAPLETPNMPAKPWIAPKTDVTRPLRRKSLHNG